MATKRMGRVKTARRRKPQGRSVRQMPSAPKHPIKSLFWMAIFGLVNANRARREAGMTLKTRQRIPRAGAAGRPAPKLPAAGGGAKKERTPAQVAAFEKCRQARLAKQGVTDNGPSKGGVTVQPADKAGAAAEMADDLKAIGDAGAV